MKPHFKTIEQLSCPVAVSLIALVVGLGTVTKARAQDNQTEPAPVAPAAAAPTPTNPAPATPSTATPATPQTTSPSKTVPEIVVNAPKPKRKLARAQHGAGTRSTATETQAAPTSTTGGEPGSISATPLQQVPTLGKTDTKLADLPMSVQIIPRQLLIQQGDTMLRQAITNASGVNQGGQDSLGYFDHFLIRGLNAQMYTDGFSDGDQLGGVSHSLNGVQRIEVLEGPGSALFGSGPPGGTINIVHFLPSPIFQYGISTQVGSFGTITNHDWVTGPTTVQGLNYRVDATFSHSDGFRSLGSQDLEVRPDVTWKVNDHFFEASIDARSINQTPDSYGLIYFHGTPINNVPIDSKYSTPWAFADQTFVRPIISDKWYVSDFLTVNNRFAYTNRNIEAMRNGDSTRTTVCTNPLTQNDPVTGKPCILDQVIGRQLREQDDVDNSYDYQFEPVWKFGTGPIGHTLLTGLEVLHQDMHTQRTTADLPNIANVFAPAPPELSPAGLNFLCDASHSCDNDRLMATYLSAYATDQIDVTERWKIRAGLRQEWWDTSLLPLITVPGRFTSSGVPIIANEELDARQKPLSWNVGTLYKLTPWMSPYAGVSKSYLTNFNSENTQQGIGPAETALQYEGGVKFSFLDEKIVLTTAAFHILRNNVAAAVTLNGVETVVFDAQKTDGVEANLDAKITDQWHVFANATAMDAVITNNPQGITSVGNHPQGVPRYLANLWTTYDFSIAGIHGFQAGLGVNYQDKSYSDITNVNSIPSATILNAELAYFSPTWDVILNLKNLTNARYFIAANAAGAYVGDGLSAYLTVRFKQ